MVSVWNDTRRGKRGATAVAAAMVGTSVVSVRVTSIPVVSIVLASFVVLFRRVRPGTGWWLASFPSPSFFFFSSFRLPSTRMTTALFVVLPSLFPRRSSRLVSVNEPVTISAAMLVGASIVVVAISISCGIIS